MKCNWKTVEDALNEPEERDKDWVVIKSVSDSLGIFYVCWQLYLVKCLPDSEEDMNYEDWFSGWDYIEDVEDDN